MCQQGYNHMRCLYNLHHYDVLAFTKINTPLETFLRNSKSPFIFESDELSPCTSAYDKDFKHIFLNGSISDYMVFEWPEQIMRCRAVLLLKATE